jgi:hypothetical protein
MHLPPSNRAIFKTLTIPDDTQLSISCREVDRGPYSSCECMQTLSNANSADYLLPQTFSMPSTGCPSGIFPSSIFNKAAETDGVPPGGPYSLANGTQLEIACHLPTVRRLPPRLLRELAWYWDISEMDLENVSISVEGGERCVHWKGGSGVNAPCPPEGFFGPGIEYCRE